MINSCFRFDFGSSDETLPEVALDYDQRKKSRFRATDSEDEILEVYLPRGTVLRHGMILIAEAGRRVRVVARPQSLSEVRGEPSALLPLAYHLGNRHLPLEVESTALRYESDHVIDDMVRQLGLTPTQVEVPFQPLDGAYKHGHHEH